MVWVHIPYMVRMLLIFHEKYVFVPIYGLGAHSLYGRVTLYIS